jgi:hypothetical protein
MPTDWAAIAAAVTSECPSPTLRGAVVGLLSRVEMLGPIRPPQEEFKRVYQSLRWNESDRLRDIVDALLPRAKGESPKIEIHADAWGYVVGVLDEWITQARIFYLVAGILEGALRARLDARLTDTFGEEWVNVPNLVPSKLHELATVAQREAQLAAVHDIVEATAAAPGPVDGAALLAALQAALQPPPQVQAMTGAQFLRGLSFGGLRMFFEKKELWQGKAQLEEVFRGRDGQGPKVQHDRMRSVLGTLNEARNGISHYSPVKCLTFDNPLFAAATLALWLGEDLQHIYGAIDTRHTTELSVALAPLAKEAGWTDRDDGHVCADECKVAPPFDWLLERAPRDRADLPTVGVRRACLYHRVANRVALHRPGHVPK